MIIAIMATVERFFHSIYKICFKRRRNAKFRQISNIVCVFFQYFAFLLLFFIEDTPSNKIQALTKSTHMNIWLVDLTIRGFYTPIKFSKKEKI